MVTGDPGSGGNQRRVEERAGGNGEWEPCDRSPRDDKWIERGAGGRLSRRVESWGTGG